MYSPHQVKNGKYSFILLCLWFISRLCLVLRLILLFLHWFYSLERIQITWDNYCKWYFHFFKSSLRYILGKFFKQTQIARQCWNVHQKNGIWCIKNVLFLLWISVRIYVNLSPVFAVALIYFCNLVEGKTLTWAPRHNLWYTHSIRSLTLEWEGPVIMIE